MTEQQFRERLKKSIDKTLSGLPEDSRLCQRIESAGRKENHSLNKRLVPKALTIMTAIVFITLTTALASGIFGNVNWFGDIVPDNMPEVTLEPFPTAAPLTDHAPSVSLFERSQEILRNRGEREMVVVYDGSGSTWAPMAKELSSMEEFQDLIKAADYLPVPQYIPDGYEFCQGTLLYDCHPEGQYHLLASERTAEGLDVERYTVDESTTLISCYDLIFRRNGNAEDYLSIFVRLEYATDPTEHSFGLNSDQESRIVTIAGMDNALAILSDSHTSINMRRVLGSAIPFRAFAPIGGSAIDTYAEVHADVTSRQLSIEELSSVFAEN